ncbi:MAG: acyl-CoA dehydrogenase family protein [Dehalococcoidia bacterium]|uniref:acyl-CoA dehydrogenase family protein n=1 Tax=Candidatus Amarobacter glycogenicus TaxID=3140699 RepID=UPI003135CBAD|nr:acyl-CoA dehydrogenase family protein [Dehalococcoidia bacterium]
MRFTDTPELASWRGVVRAFVAENWKPGGPHDELAMHGPNAAAYEEITDKTQNWLDKLAANSWIAPAWPKKYGGADMSVLEQFVLNQELHEAGAPTSRPMMNLVGPTVMLHGTDDQKAEHLPPLLRGEVRWCQGFSEPGSGSDLASLQTRAVRDGDDYVINGQKIWTSGAHRAQWMFMMARTDPSAPKHRGISYLLVPMTAPGITVRPLMNMADGHSFNEVFFEDVRVPVRNRIGEENRGWYVGATTLDFERSNISRAIHSRKSVAKLARFTRDRAAARHTVSAAHRMEIVDRAIETAVVEQLSFVIVSMQAAGGVPNKEASMCKMFGSELAQRIALTEMHVTGMSGQLRESSLVKSHGLNPTMAYLSVIPQTIAAGSSEIQRNIIATRGLGLPRG